MSSDSEKFNGQNGISQQCRILLHNEKQMKMDKKVRDVFKSRYRKDNPMATKMAFFLILFFITVILIGVLIFTKYDCWQTRIDKEGSDTLIFLNENHEPGGKKLRTTRNRKIDRSKCIKDNYAVISDLSGTLTKCKISENKIRADRKGVSALERIKCYGKTGIIKAVNIVKCGTEAEIDDYLQKEQQARIGPKRGNSQTVDQATGLSDNNKIGIKIDPESVEKETLEIMKTNLIGKSILTPRKNKQPIEGVVKTIINNTHIKVSYKNEDNIFRENDIPINILKILNPVLFKEFGQQSPISSSQNTDNDPIPVIPLWTTNKMYLEFLQQRHVLKQSTIRPKYTWLDLAELAFIDNKTKLLSLKEILNFVITNFKYYETITNVHKASIQDLLRKSPRFQNYKTDDFGGHFHFIAMGAYFPPDDATTCEAVFYEPVTNEDSEFLYFHQMLPQMKTTSSPLIVSRKTVMKYIFYDKKKTILTVPEAKTWVMENILFYKTMKNDLVLSMVERALSHNDIFVRRENGDKIKYLYPCSFPDIKTSLNEIIPAGLDKDKYMSEKVFNSDEYGYRTPSNEILKTMKEVQDYIKRVNGQPKTDNIIWLSNKALTLLNNKIDEENEPRFLYGLSTDINNLFQSATYFGLTVDPQIRLPFHRVKFPNKIFYMWILNLEWYSLDVVSCLEHVFVKLACQGKIENGQKFKNSKTISRGPLKGRPTTSCSNTWFNDVTKIGHPDYQKTVSAVNEWLKFLNSRALRIVSNRVGVSERRQKTREEYNNREMTEENFYFEDS